MRTVDIKPIPTRYRGVLYRSRLEARWAVFLDEIDAKPQYEPEGYVLDGRPYLVDFLAHSLDLFIEVKPTGPTPDELAKAAKLADGTGKPVLIVIGPPNGDQGRYIGPFPAGVGRSPCFFEHDPDNLSRLAKCCTCGAVGVAHWEAGAPGRWWHPLANRCSCSRLTGLIPQPGHGFEEQARRASNMRFDLEVDHAPLV